ncbi:hypothetical protein [Acidipila sp. EB88]|uniref:hypothetical protein n=1 Tax=Acidipila sp. EB88 TaxID=2305226 RepID=UPI000F5E62F4|nr:hypothetical protein [Acidipila sp. EB88]RRA49237.1 hypothetical protein D1Y84_14110 [Acidipila sp. EB88]
MRLCSVLAALLLVSLGLSACGKNYYFAGRALPPSGILNRVLLACQISGRGQLFLVDGLYDVRHNYNNTVASFPISGYTATSLPITVQNLPAEQVGVVFSISDGSLSTVNYATETATTLLAPPATNVVASSVFTSSNRQYIVAAQQQLHEIEMYDASTAPTTFLLNLPGVYRVSVNPAGTIALAFVQNSDTVYSVVHLTSAQQQAAAALPPSQNGGRFYDGAEDCEPQNLPQYCVFAVDTSAAPVDRPIRTVFSPDGSSAYVIDCGPECGGQTAGLTQIPLTGTALNPGTTGPAGIALKTSTFIPVPGGATDALFNGNTLYVAGQQLVPADQLFTGMLSVVNITNNSVSAPIPISDGTHSRMVLADDDTLWIGSSSCQGGERYRMAQNGSTNSYGCMTMVNTDTNTVTTIESYKGDGTGIAAVTGLHKVYTAEGGQVYIYGTTAGAALDNTNVTVAGTVVDVAYMDAPDDSDNTWY